MCGTVGIAQAVMRVRERKPRQESEGSRNRSCGRGDANPIVMLVPSSLDAGFGLFVLSLRSARPYPTNRTERPKECRYALEFWNAFTRLCDGARADDVVEERLRFHQLHRHSDELSRSRQDWMP